MNNKDVLNRALSPFLRELVTSLLNEKPEDPIPYMIMWIENKLGITNSISEKEELYRLRKEMTALKSGEASEN